MKQPNLLILLSDALRPDHLGCYGSTSGNSPRIDALAKEGLLFENAFTVSPVTNVSIATLFTGCLPMVHGVRLHTAVMNRALPTLAELLRREGCQTGAVVSCATLDRSRGLDRGFDYYNDSFGAEEPKGIKGRDPDERTISRHSGTAVSLAVEWLRGLNRDRPFFLFLHLFDTHSPYDPPRDYRERHPTNYTGPVNGSEKEGLAIKLGEFRPSPEDVSQLNYLYGGELNFTDGNVGRLLDFIRNEDRGPWLTVFTADHGVHLGERGVWGSGRRLYDRELRVPLILHGVEELRGRRVSQLVSNTDVMPTLLEVLNVPAAAPMNGRSRLVDARDARLNEDMAVYAETFMPAWRENQRLAVRNRRWKLIAPVPESDAAFLQAGRSLKDQWVRVKRLLYRLWHSPKGRAAQLRRALDILLGGKEKRDYLKIEEQDRRLLGKEPELYDVANDPLEEHNRFAAEPRVARLMQNELSFFSSRYVCGQARMESLSDDQLREANEVLHQLGYK